MMRAVAAAAAAELLNQLRDLESFTRLQEQEAADWDSSRCRDVFLKR